MEMRRSWRKGELFSRKVDYLVLFAIEIVCHWKLQWELKKEGHWSEKLFLIYELGWKYKK